MPIRKRYGFLAALAALIAACSSSTNSGTAYLILSPFVDSLFIGDSAPASQVTYYDASGNQQPAGTVSWSSSATGVATVNSQTGVIHAVGAGNAVITAAANGATGQVLVAVSRTLDLTILLDTIYQMPGDTLTIPVSVRHQNPAQPTVWFTAVANPAFKIDSASGRDTALSQALPFSYVVHALLGTDSIADTGYVQVLLPTDTTKGYGFFTVYGSLIRHVPSTARGLNYPRGDKTPTFRLRSYVNQGTSTVEVATLVQLAAVTAPGSFVIDSISPGEAFATSASQSPFCYPPRSWGAWSALFTTFRIDALSRPAGHLGITQIRNVTGGQVISGSYYFVGQRTDFYTDPQGAVAIRGTFVAPLTTTTAACK